LCDTCRQIEREYFLRNAELGRRKKPRGEGERPHETAEDSDRKRKKLLQTFGWTGSTTWPLVV
jgi:hypothetical protein